MSLPWFVRKGPQTLGPFDRADMQRLLRSGKFGSHIQVANSAEGPWLPLEAASELALPSAQDTLGPPQRWPVLAGASLIAAVLALFVWGLIELVADRHDAAAADRPDGRQPRAQPATP